MSQTAHITGYRILTNEDPNELGKLVEAAIHDGWQPLGGLCVSPRGDGYRAVYAQSMATHAEWGG